MLPRYNDTARLDVIRPPASDITLIRSILRSLKYSVNPLKNVAVSLVTSKCSLPIYAINAFTAHL